ncbi:MAG: hypothetical protein ABIW31_00880 [Novosphingobium sp.]
MKKFAFAALASIAVLSLSACGKSDDPNAQASADNADMPAEEAVNSAEANVQPVPDAATDAAADGKTSQTEKDAAAQTAKEFNDLGADAKPADAPAKPN